MSLSAILIFVTLLYSGYVMLFFIGILKTSEKNEIHSDRNIGFSIIVPFRNEAQNLKQLFESFKNLDYSAENFEIILVDDESTDRSFQLALQFQQQNKELDIQLLKNSAGKGSPKKRAIENAIKIAKFDHICTTDADCEIPKEWLTRFSEELQKSAAGMVCGPVGFKPKQKLKWFQILEELDFLSLQAVTMGSFGVGKEFMCNAANLCFSRTDFVNVNGYSGNEHIAGGDDVFLLQKFKQNGIGIQFMKCKKMIVRTHHQESLKKLTNQRARWGMKTSAYHTFFSKLLGVTVLSIAVFLLIYALLCLFGFGNWNLLLVVFAVKFGIDLMVLLPAANFFGRTKILMHYPWVSIIHPAFYGITAFSILFTSFEWKGRKFRK